MTEQKREHEVRRRRRKPEQSSQTGSSGGVSSLGIYADGSMGDSTLTGSPESSGASPGGAKKSPSSSSR